MTKLQKIIAVIFGVVVVLLIGSVAVKQNNSVGGVYNNVTHDFSEGISVDGTSFISGAGNINAFGVTNVIGDAAKTAYNKLAGYTKVDYRPTGGGTNSYALQIRHNVGSTSGNVISLDHEAHIVATGTATLRGTQGVAVVDSTYTSTDTTLIGTYGQARADGTVAGSSFLAGLYGLIEEGGGAITASHVASGWFDSHRNTAVTGEHELIYMSNNGTATMDSAMYIYGGNKVTNLLKLNTVGGMVSGPSTAASGTPVKIQIDVDGTPYYINAYPTSNN